MKRTMSFMCAMTFGVALSGSPAIAAEDAEDFVKTAIRGNIAEVQMGELAQKQAKNPRLQELGSMLVNDHSKARKEAVELAKDMNIDPPTKPTEDAQETYDRLAKMSGDEFDEEFVEVAVEDHEEDIEAYTEQAEDADNEQVAAYARTTLPVLEKHLEMAQKLEDKVN